MRKMGVGRERRGMKLIFFLIKYFKDQFDNDM